MSATSSRRHSLSQLRRLYRRHRRSTANRRRCRTQPFLEHLEDRRLLAAKAWDGGAGTSYWNDAGNWNPDGVPGASDDVSIVDLDDDITVSITSGTHTINSLHSEERLIISGASISIAATSELASVALAGTLSGTGEVRITGSLEWSRGRISGPGSTNIAPGAVFSMANPSISLNLSQGRTLNNYGTATREGAVMGMSDGAVINNYGEFRVEGVASMGGGSFENHGRFVSNAPSVTVAVAFSNVTALQGARRLSPAVAARCPC